MLFILLQSCAFGKQKKNDKGNSFLLILNRQCKVLQIHQLGNAGQYTNIWECLILYQKYVFMLCSVGCRLLLFFCFVSFFFVGNPHWLPKQFCIFISNGLCKCLSLLCYFFQNINNGFWMIFSLSKTTIKQFNSETHLLLYKKPGLAYMAY